MKIALLHYHLKPGGVTTVIRHQVEALQKDCRLLVFSGEPPQGPFPAPVVHIPGLAYDTPEQPVKDPLQIAADIHRAILKEWPTGCDLLHVHNPTIAKNSVLLDILKALKARGLNLFLQIHDFAEDGRPGAYFKADYPGNCHYGVINSRDYRVLRKAGLKPTGLHLVRNPVKALPLNPQPVQGENEILYPVRAIRRKNIGESLLLSLYFPAGSALSITLPPNSPVDLKPYHEWKDFARSNHLRVRFEAGLSHHFEDLVSGALYLLTTSVTEGFGYTFLEGWTAGKQVRGRNLAGITRDFTEQDIRLTHFYDHLFIPLSWIDHRCFFSRWKACMQENSEYFGLHLNSETIARTWEDMQAGGMLDFGLLDESFQKVIIGQLIADTAKMEHLAEINPFLKTPMPSAGDAGMIAHNRRIVSKLFAIDNYRENLLAVYRKVTGSTVNQHIDKACLASFFFNPERFSLLKWGAYVD